MMEKGTTDGFQRGKENRPPKGLASRAWVVLFLLALVVMGFGTKVYRGRFEGWFHNYGGGIVYEVFWVVLFCAVFPHQTPERIALWVFAGTCGLEFLQLWHPPFLEAARSNLLGRTLLGHGFDRWDFIYYAVGATIGCALCRWIGRRGCPRRAS